MLKDVEGNDKHQAYGARSIQATLLLKGENEMKNKDIGYRVGAFMS